uniref:Uncharacterized protein n=1 Tax=viral metagenome TaxID=1070528 RepID=A0A6C0E3C2_9ZZZZ
MVEENEYRLPLLDKLTDNKLHLDSYNEDHLVKVICYHIHANEAYPFIQVMLYNNGSSLSLPCLDRSTSTITDTLINEISFALDLQRETDKCKIKPQGFLDGEDSVRYFFVDLSALSTITGVFLQNDTSIWFGLLSELVNNKMIYSLSVNKDVCDFFYNHYDLFILHNPSTGLKYPLPDVVYYGSHFKITEFQNEFGINKQKRKLGEYFYYTYALEDAIEEGVKDNQEYVASIFMGGGINRVALLVDNMIYLNEEEIDKQDDCETYISGLMEVHDSIFVCSKHKSFILMKDIHRQVSLSYHKIEDTVVSRDSWWLYTVD